jgi:excisionase family DNA binding protein
MKTGARMSAAPLREETYLPDEPVASVHDFMEAHETRRGTPIEARYFLSGSTPGDRVELPSSLYQILRQVVEALQQGLAVTVAPKTKTLTTQQAADLLGVSRPTVIRLLDDGKIPYERAGTHRRILLQDLIAYREQRRAAQYAALQSTAVDFEDEEDLEETLKGLREARRAVAAQRRKRSS